MLSCKVFAIVLLSILGGVSADYTDHFRLYKLDPLIVVAAEREVTQTATYFKKTDVIGYCNVKNQPALGALAHVLTQMNSTKAIETFVKDCNALNANFTMDTFNKAYENATQYLVDVSQDPTFDPESLVPYNQPIKLSQDVVDAAYHSTVSRYQNFNYGLIYGVVLDCYWFLLIFLSGIWNLFKRIAPGFIRKFCGPITNKFRKHITLPALFGKTHNDYYYIGKIFPTLIPTRAESLMIAGYLILVLAFNTANYQRVPHNTIWESQGAEIGRKIADRSGQMLLFAFPLLVLFAGRNNFLQLITDWHYSTFILIHKWVARVACILVILHGAAMSVTGKSIGAYYTRNAQPYVRWGLVSATAMCLTSFLAMNALRKTRYELFLAIHILLASIIMAGAWLHTKGADFGYQQFMIASVAIWVFDRVMRIARLVSFGVQKATVQLIAEETLKVTVKRPSYWKPFPGSHAFIHFLKPTMFWQSHPFTIVDEVNEKNTITCYIKVKGGMTHGLYQFLSKQPNQTGQIPISVEGPYGKHLPLSRYDRTIFIGSGNGIPGLYEEAKQLLAHKPTESSSIKFVWIIRHYKSIEWFYEELLNLKAEGIDINIYITNGTLGIKQFWNDTDTSNSKTDKEKEEQVKNYTGEIINEDNEKVESIIEQLKSNLSHITFNEGRPDLDDLIKQEIVDATGTLAVSTCCHASIDDQCRKSIATHIDKSKHRVDLFDQIQIW